MTNLIAEILTAPLGFLYGVVATARNLLYERGILAVHHSPVPVVSIGNLTAGGNGKTPLCVAVARGLEARGYRPVVVSRGYGGTLRGPVRVGPHHTPAEVGDEPFMMAEALPAVVISRRRAAGAALVAREGLGDVIILDDGFQHRALARALDVVAIDVSTEESKRRFLEGKMLPRGFFREPRDRGLRRAGIVVLSNRCPPPSEAEAVDQRLLGVLPSDVKVFRSFLSTLPPVPVSNGGSGPLVPPAKVFAFCGLAFPTPFFLTLERQGFLVVGERRFSDHHGFTDFDLSKLRSESGGLPLVCTEKDAVKLRGLDTTGVYFVKATARIEPEDAFFVRLLRTLLSAPGRVAKAPVGE